MAGAWILGVGLVYPVFATLRQLAEHRATEATQRETTAPLCQLPVTRMFTGGWSAALLGGAGFRRHLLHHWEPGVSCTQLPLLERYLQGTSAAALLEARTATYAGALVEIWRYDNP